MQGHEHFEELSSLALIGDLSPAQMEELNAHLADCAECRSSQADLHALTNNFLTVQDRSKLRAAPGEDIQMPLLRGRVIASARELGLRISDEAMFGPQSLWERAMDYMRRGRWEFRQWWPRTAVALCIALLAIGGGILAERLSDTRNELNESNARLAHAESKSTELNIRLQQISQAKDSAGGQLLRTQAELTAAKQRTDELIAELQRDKVTIVQLQEQTASLRSENSTAAENSAAQAKVLAAAQDQLQRTQAHASAIEADLVAQQYQIRDLTAQLETEKLGAERERELMAADHEIRDLMGARDLHMIDVRDVDLKGNWKQPYGRIFLTDNKQLIFYAFDLHKAGGQGKWFQVWGQRFDNESSTVSLGTFHLDDQKQSRWIMKVSNPQLLSSIDSIFVTVENSPGGKRPTGRPLMNAYLRNPINHP
jgi:DNA repair exonuclease SbcCD ATPase subunit